jgi:transcriptional regulator with XRE-family HTH domain
MNLPERLKEARKAAGLTQEDVAKRLGISKSTYCCYETGRHSPDPNALVILCKAFNVSADYLLGIEKGPSDTEEPISKEAVSEVLIQNGFIKPGQDLSDKDLDFLIHYLDVLGLWFDKSKE